jgi:hypothetical protein
MADPIEGRVWIWDNYPGEGDITFRLWNFVTGRHELKPEHRAELGDTVYRAIMTPRVPPVVHLIGLASPAGDPLYNLRLSDRRIQSVRAYLREAGVPESRFASMISMPVGEGLHDPRLDENAAEERAVEIIVTPMRSRPNIRLPRPPVREPREDLPPLVEQPISRRFAIKLDAAGNLGRLLTQFSPLRAALRGAGLSPTVEVVLFTIKAFTHPPQAANYIYYAAGAGAGLSLPVTAVGPWNPFHTTASLHVIQFAGPAEFGGGGVRAGDYSAGVMALLMYGPVPAGAAPVLIVPFRGGLGMGISIRKTNGNFLYAGMTSAT